jgi:hypothetical protein
MIPGVFDGLAVAATLAHTTALSHGEGDLELKWHTGEQYAAHVGKPGIFLTELDIAILSELLGVVVLVWAKPWGWISPDVHLNNRTVCVYDDSGVERLYYEEQFVELKTFTSPSQPRHIISLHFLGGPANAGHYEGLSDRRYPNGGLERSSGLFSHIPVQQGTSLLSQNAKDAIASFRSGELSHVHV